MRRLPIYFLVDVSESMVGTPIEQVQEGMRTIIQNLRVDPYALETVFVSIIAFAGKAKVLSPLTELYKFYPPTFPIGGGTSLGAGLEALMNDLDTSIQKTTLEQKGDWKPIIFLFTDGNPTDNYQAAFRRWNEKYRKHCSLIAVSLGDNVNVLTLAQITNDILLLKETDAESFSKFFKWVTASIKTTSMSVSEQNTDEVKLAPTTGINLEKVNPNEHKGTVDENFVVLHGRCQTTKNDYLVKYAKRTEPLPGLEMFNAMDFKLVGAYPIDKESYAALSAGTRTKINTMELVGVPTCPCCGNQHGVVVCECGGIFCVGEQSHNECPWCGMKGELGSGGPEGMDITRGLG
ncbi:TerY-C metal binding domain-containing protein [Bacteroides acidifaciens]|uniref:TerY-C metal binding domain-containing protein n=1 Tax=Bacteroides acidifaciens TaxID=85831 RepID=UPI0025B2D4F8|nr:TerY-C metal binding domain-containing protein [Bacteroides acidifaciens]